MIYTDNDRRLCCLLCGGVRLDFSGSRPTNGNGYRQGVALRFRCFECEADFEYAFTPARSATEVSAVVYASSAVELARVEAKYLDTQTADSSPHRERQSDEQAHPGTRVTPHSHTASERSA